MSGATPGEPVRTWRTADELLVVHSGVRDDTSPPTTCRLRLYRPAGRDPVAVVTELAWNRGPSITNVAESVWRAVAALLGSERFLLVEHYGPASYADGEQADRYAVVTLDGSGRPTWRHLSTEELHHLIGGRPMSTRCSRRRRRRKAGVLSLLREAALTLGNPPIPRWGH